MCIQCYKDAGSPQIINDKTKRAAELTRLVYNDHGAGGWCHIVLDDFNIEDGHIDYCLEQIEIEPDDGTHDTQKACMLLFKSMTMDERASALALYDGWLIDA